MRLFIRGLLAAGLAATAWLGGCAPYFHQPLSPSPARLGAEVRANSDLLTLPAAQQRVVVAVYKFRDQTGQYKPTTNGSSFSTAITQGATSVLLRALEESQWFEPIERENLGNLLNERKIIRSSRAEFAEQSNQKPLALPPLLFAGVLLEGGIISYDANMLTGGAGLRYFGAGASGQYRQDRVTIYLRAISTSNGKILKTVYTSKTILSQQVDASLFRFVKFKRLLETETGFTYNEPTEIAVKDAIEKAVQALVLEGIQEGLWQPLDPAERQGRAMQAYAQEKKDNLNLDVLDRAQADRRGVLGLQVSGGSLRYSGDYGQALTRPGYLVALHFRPTAAARWGAAFAVGSGNLAAGTRYRQTLYFSEFSGLVRLFPRDRYTPYLRGGLGASFSGASSGLSQEQAVPHAVGGLGLEYLVWNRLGLSAELTSRYMLTDRLDAMEHGKYNDYYWGGNVGVTFYLGGRLGK